MGFGSYDEQEHEKREQKMEIDTSEESIKGTHDGQLTTEGGDDTDALLDQLAEMKDAQEKDTASDERSEADGTRSSPTPLS